MKFLIYKPDGVGSLLKTFALGASGPIVVVSSKPFLQPLLRTLPEGALMILNVQTTGWAKKKR